MKNYFTNKSFNLLIGDFGISYSWLTHNIPFEIPVAGMAFYQPEHVSEVFQMRIADIKEELSRKIIFGSPDYSPPTFLYQNECGDFNWITKKKDGSSAMSFHISKDWNKFVLYEDETGTNGMDTFYEFGSLFSYAVLNHDACVLHGVVMEYEGRGILVTASSGTGKTTHTRMWRDYKNALILNGDRCLCRKIDGIWYAYGMPWSGSSGEYINRRVPIKAIVSLKQDKTNHTRILPHFEGSIYLMQRIFAPVWQCEMQDKAFELTEELAGNFPIIELSCRPDLEAVEVLEKAILKQEADNGQ